MSTTLKGIVVIMPGYFYTKDRFLGERGFRPVSAGGHFQAVWKETRPVYFTCINGRTTYN